MKKALYTLLVLLISTSAFAITEHQKIDKLLQTIEKSNLVFVRNDSEHSAAKAASHLRRKYNHAKDNIQTAIQFIEKIASKSSFTGRPYYIKLKDGTKIKSETWLKKQLQLIEKKYK